LSLRIFVIDRFAPDEEQFRYRRGRKNKRVPDRTRFYYRFGLSTNIYFDFYVARRQTLFIVTDHKFNLAGEIGLYVCFKFHNLDKVDHLLKIIYMTVPGAFILFYN